MPFASKRREVEIASLYSVPPTRLDPMKRKRTSITLLLSSVLFAATLFQCSYVKQFQQGMTNLSRCKFKLQGVGNVTIAGVSLAGKRQVSDFSLMDGINLSKAFATKSFPTAMTIYVGATNPNDGSGGYPQTTATLVGFPWTLLIDGKQTISGDIGGRPEIPGTGKSTTIDLVTSLDLYKFFGDKGYADVMNLALAIGGANSSAAKLTLRGTPRVSTPLGDISYPSAIDVVDKEWRN
jgi:hypothetical protein